MQLISVTLLASPHAGIRLALWDSVLLLSVPGSSWAGRVGQLLGTPQVVTPAAGAVALRIGGFWAVALTTASFSTLSELELRRSKAHLDALTTMAAEMEEAMESGCAEQIAAVLLKAVLYPFAFKQVAVLWERKGHVLEARFFTGAEDVVVLSRSRPGRASQGRHRHPALRRPPAPASPRSGRGDGPTLQALVPGATNIVVVPLKAGREGRGLLLAESGPPASRRMSRRSLEMVSRFAGPRRPGPAQRRPQRRDRPARPLPTPSPAWPTAAPLPPPSAGRWPVPYRTKEPLSLAIMDIDFFKKINDTYGHVAGDEVLRAVADAMAANIRDVDVVARYGGEEFAIVLPNCPSDGALIVVERVRAAVSALPTVTRVTVSAGIATSRGTAGADAERLMADADEALYASKRAGRDRATLAPPPPPPPPAAPSPALAL